MPLWTLRGLRQGTASLKRGAGDVADTRQGARGMPTIGSPRCAESCKACAQACPTDAISLDTRGHLASLDYGKCIGCQRCVEACPSGTLQHGDRWATAAMDRRELIWNLDPQGSTEEQVRHQVQRVFQGSLHIRHVDAGSCNGCESELQALNNPLYNFHRLGIFFTASPRAADLLLVTGVVTPGMRDALRATWDAMPEPRWVMASGTCAVSGGLFSRGDTSGGIGDVLPVDIWVPGCPPNPGAIMEALLILLGRAPAHAGLGVRR